MKDQAARREKYLQSRHLREILDSIENAKSFTDKTLSTINHGIEGLPKVMKDISDRNRTSPVAFTGNKFELRALGASANGADAAKVMNMLCAYGYEQLIAKLEKKKGDVKKNALIVLKDVLKTLVYELAAYRNRIGTAIPERVITRPPSAELAPDQEDTDSLPPYEILDPILEAFIEHDLGADEIVAKGFDEKTVEKIMRMVVRNEYKRRQAPPGVRITRRAFGRDRRYPITSGFN